MKVAMLKKTCADVKKIHRFLFDFSLVFREKSTENQAKSVTTVFVHKNRQKIKFRTHLFNKKTIWGDFWDHLGSPGFPGTSRERPEIAHCSHSWSISPENEPRRPPGGLRKTPELPPGASRVRFCIDFWIDFAQQKLRKKMQKVLKKTRKILQNSKEAWLWLGRPMNSW